VIVAGIDSGLYSTKVVLLEQGRILAEAVVPAGMETADRAAERGLEVAFQKAGSSRADLRYTVVTGRGKSFISFVDEAAPDFMCLAQGMYRILPSVHSALDVGAEKSLAVRCSRGRVLNMASNDKCASGTGTYLQMVSNILGVPLEGMGQLSLSSTEKVEVDNTCAVFAESEIISLVHSKKKPQDILRGVYQGLALRLHPLLVQVGLEREVALVGGVALDIGVRRAMAQLLGYEVLVPNNPLTVGALGAAMIAEAKVERTA
jgi:benzoyl-CoA reductase subunit D